MDERPDEVRRDPLDRREPLTEGGRDPGPVADPLTEPVGGPEEVRPDSGLDPVLAGEAEVDEVEVTRAEIERTRSDMSETVDAIQGRLSPENLKEQAKDRVREATLGKAQGAGSTIVETIRANPLPAALTGIGLSWLFVSGRRRSSGQEARYRDRVYDAYDRSPAYDYPPRYEEQGASGSSAGQAFGPETGSAKPPPKLKTQRNRSPARPKTRQERSPARPKTQRDRPLARLRIGLDA